MMIMGECEYARGFGVVEPFVRRSQLHRQLEMLREHAVAVVE